VIRDLLRDVDWHEAALDIVTFLALGVCLIAYLLIGAAVIEPR
jgi:hypothetical protein